MQDGIGEAASVFAGVCPRRVLLNSTNIGTKVADYDNQRVVIATLYI